MDIIAHRGYWLFEKEKNTKIAFERAFDNDFGVETDLRDYCGELVISHNIPQGEEITVEEFFALYKEKNKQTCLALNIKADGLQEKLKFLLEKYSIKNYFLFDMSIPDTIGYINQKLNIFSRKSEYETELPFYEKSTGVWLDCFKSDWITNQEIASHLKACKNVCIVSSELHKREHKNAWQKYKPLNTKNIMLCTDYPQEAKEFFNEKD